LVAFPNTIPLLCIHLRKQEGTKKTAGRLKQIDTYQFQSLFPDIQFAVFLNSAENIKIEEL